MADCENCPISDLPGAFISCRRCIMEDVKMKNPTDELIAVLDEQFAAKDKEIERLENAECKYLQQKPCEHIKSLQAENATLRERLKPIEDVWNEWKSKDVSQYPDDSADSFFFQRGVDCWQAICKVMEI